MPPRTFNTKTRRRGTAWKATEGEEIRSPVGASRRDSVSSDPAFDFNEEDGSKNVLLSPKKFGKAKLVTKSPSSSSSRSSSSSSRRAAERRAAERPSRRSTRSGPTTDSKQSASQKMEGLEAKILELEKALQDRQTETGSALAAMDTQLQKVTRDLEATTKERDSLKNRLAKAESLLQKVSNNQIKLISDPNDMIETTESRLTCLEDSDARQNESLEKLKNQNEKLEDASEIHDKEICLLEERLSANEKHATQMGASLEKESRAAAKEREQMKREIQTLSKQMSNKDSRIKKLELYIEEREVEARQLTALLAEFDRKFHPVELTSKKRKSDEGAVTRRKSQKKSGNPQGVTAWLNRYQRPITRTGSKTGIEDN